MTEAVAPEPTPEQAAMFARVRRMMLIASLHQRAWRCSAAVL